MSRPEPAVPPGFVICRIADGRFAESVGPLYLREGEPARFGFLAEPRHGNVRESVHGGMLMTLADQVLGLTVMQAVGLETPVVTVSLHCDFVSAASPGEWIEGEATITRMTRSLIFVRGSLSHGQRVVLSAAGVWKKVGGARGNRQGIGEHQA